MTEQKKYTTEELRHYYHLPLPILLKESAKYMGESVELCSLINAKNGRCSQNCKYCAQSAFYKTQIQTYPLVSVKQVQQAAQDAKKNGAIRFAIVTSGKTPDEDKDFQKELEMIQAINAIEGLSSCASIGVLNEEQVKKLAQIGLKRVHHNINTCKSYYPNVCTTHTWEERFNTCQLVKKYGMELCCGVILGMGETEEHRIEMAQNLAEIGPDSIPINILMPIQNTPFENYGDKINEEHILRTMAVFKIANPKAVLRFCGGRTRISEKNQELALKTCVEGILTGNYLTKLGKTPQEDKAMLYRLGKELLTR